LKSIDNTELLQIIARDEDSSHQFKADVTNELSVAQEMIAFSNAISGMLLIGVSDDGSIFKRGCLSPTWTGMELSG